jgi:hypothetical protein
MARRRVPHSLPSEASPAGEFARGQALLVGPAVQAPAGSVAEADYLARGDFLAALAAAVATTQAQAFLTTATSLLAEWELAYGLPVDSSLTIAQRQARLVAKVRTLRGGSPQALANMARAYDATALVYENTPASVPQAPDPFDDRRRDRGAAARRVPLRPARRAGDVRGRGDARDPLRVRRPDEAGARDLHDPHERPRGGLSHRRPQLAHRPRRGRVVRHADG